MSRTAFLTFFFVFSQSVPPSFDSAGGVPPTNRVILSMRSVGRDTRSVPANCSSRYSRSTPATSFVTKRSKRAMPCSSWTTRSPGLRSMSACAKATRRRRRSGWRGFRKPNISASVKTRSPMSGATNPSASGTCSNSSAPAPGISCNESWGATWTSRSASVSAELQLHRLFEHQRRSLRQVVEQRRTRSNERRERLHAVRITAPAQPVHEHAPRRGVVAVVEIVPAVRREVLRRLCRALEGKLAGGQDHDLRDGIERALRAGIEAPQRLDLISGQLDAHRPLGGGRKDVEDATAARESSGLGHLRHRLQNSDEPPVGHPRPRTG